MQTPTQGTVWPGKTYFPDFHAKKTTDWWHYHVDELWQTYKFDGLWVDMNEPASFEDMDCPENSYGFSRGTSHIKSKLGRNREKFSASELSGDINFFYKYIIFILI